MSRSLRGMFEMTHGSPVPASSHSPAPAQDEALISMIETVRKLTSAMQAAQTQGARTYNSLARSAQEWSSVASKATAQVLAVLNQQNLLEVSSVSAHSRAEQAKSLASISALKQTAFYRAIAATAAGFQALGEFNFWGAAQDFTSAALFGALAGEQIAAMAGGAAGSRARASAPGNWSRGHGSGEGSGVPVSALSAGAASAAGPPSGHLTVAIMGDHEAGEWLAKTLNTAVEQRGVQLTSTRSTRSPYAQG
jgi:hypothetical protein